MGLDQDDMDIDEDNDAARAQSDGCVRKEYRRLTAEEIRNYHAALNTMKNRGEYRLFVQYHRSSESPAAHFGPAFFPWHRCFLILYVKPNTHRRRRRDETVESRRVGGVYTNSQLVGDCFVVSSV